MSFFDQAAGVSFIILLQQSAVTYPLFHVIGKYHGIQLHNQKNAMLVAKTTLAQCQKLVEQAEHCHNFNDIDRLSTLNRRLNSLVIDTFKPVASLRVSS